MTKLQKSLVAGLLAGMAGLVFVQSAGAQIAPMDLSGIQNQAQGVIQQQSVGSQLNSLRLQQNITRDRIRELDLFRPQQPYGATAGLQPPGANLPNQTFLPDPSGLPPLPQQETLTQQAAAAQLVTPPPVPAPRPKQKKN
jgi:hypothetical protein